MHSSSMRTVRSSSRLPGGGGGVLAPAGECLPDRTLKNLMDRHVAVFHFSMGKCGKEGKKLFWDWNKWNLDKL